VYRYYPEKLYGFCQSKAGEFFFHLSSFQLGEDVGVCRCTTCPGEPWCQVDTHPPPPILGELVTATGVMVRGETGAPRAIKVARLETPHMLTGVVEIFLTQKRYGFIRGSDGVEYHLHDSEVLDGRLPLKGSKVTFFPGQREDRPRACHVRVCR